MSKMWAQVLCILSFSLGTLVEAAPHRNNFNKDKDKAEVIMVLRLPVELRIPKIEKMGQKAFDGMVQIAFDSKEVLENRWRAITTLGRVFPRPSQPHLEKALQSKEWFMRNSAALVLRYGQRDWAVKWARVLMHDQALVVRTAAVDTLRVMRVSDAVPLLWEKIYSNENYKGGQSLWIRRQIAEALVDLDQSEVENFYRLLSDKDRSVQLVAMTGLQKITKHKFTTHEEWNQWWSNRSESKVVR